MNVEAPAYGRQEDIVVPLTGRVESQGSRVAVPSPAFVFFAVGAGEHEGEVRTLIHAGEVVDAKHTEFRSVLALKDALRSGLYRGAPWSRFPSVHQPIIRQRKAQQAAEEYYKRQSAQRINATTPSG